MKRALSVAMTGAAICLSAGLQLISAGTAVAGALQIVRVPDPAQSSVDACLVLDPGGDIDFHITVRDVASIPIPLASVVINFIDCPNVVLCPPQPGDGYTVAPGPVIQTTTNLAGEVVLGIRGGGVCGDTFEKIEVRVFGILLALVDASSPDQDGNLLVDSADQAILNTKLNNNPSDPTGDLNCDGTIDSQDTGILNSHLGHDCNTPSPPGPNPDFSEVDPCLVICPAGDLAFRVLAKDDDNLPIPGASIQISFKGCFDNVVEICPPKAKDGYTVKPGPVVEAVADGNGEAIFNIRGGGVCGLAVVTVDSVVLALRTVASTDQNGDLIVDQSDVDIITLLSMNSPTDPRGDLTCDGMVGPADIASVQGHFDHNCSGTIRPRRFNFVDLRYERILLPGPLRIFVDVTNLGDDVSPETPFQFRAASLGAFRPRTTTFDALIPRLLPGETREISVTAQSSCDYRRCPANQFCKPACALAALGGGVVPRGVVQGPELPAPPSGVFPCPPSFWGGSVDVFLAGEQRDVLNTMDDIPASIGHPVYVHVCVGDDTGDTYNWALLRDATCSGWSISFVAEDSDGKPLPGMPMANPIVNSGCGFICVTPNANAPGPCGANLQVQRQAGNTTVVGLHFDSSLCAPTQVEATSWGRVKAKYR